MKLLVVFLAAFVAMASSLTAVEEFASGNLKFTCDLYGEVLKKFPKDNFVFSPFSIEVILALTRAGSRNQTEHQLTSTLHLPDQTRTEEALRQLLPSFKSNNEEGTKLLSANKMYLGKDFSIKEEFGRIATTVYDAATENVNFGNSLEAARIMNQWVEKQTNNKIKDLISPDNVDAATRLVLINALYFSGKWEYPFDVIATREEKFHTSKTTSKNVNMMHVEETLKYYESPKFNAKFLELPYLDEKVTMTIVLPNEAEGLFLLENDLESILSEPKKYTWERVAVSLPRFQIDTSLGLKPMLKNLGLTDIFAPTADLSGISKERLLVDDVIQKAFINVSESGTEAAAATAGIVVQKIGYYNVKSFLASHPFWFFITKDDALFFFGRFAT